MGVFWYKWVVEDSGVWVALRFRWLVSFGDLFCFLVVLWFVVTFGVKVGCLDCIFGLYLFLLVLLLWFVWIGLRVLSVYVACCISLLRFL